MDELVQKQSEGGLVFFSFFSLDPNEENSWILELFVSQLYQEKESMSVALSAFR